MVLNQRRQRLFDAVRRIQYERRKGARTQKQVMQDLRKRLTEEMEETGHSWLQRAQEGQLVLTSQVKRRRKRTPTRSTLQNAEACCTVAWLAL